MRFDAIFAILTTVINFQDQEKKFQKEF